jgi:hypothetical protein
VTSDSNCRSAKPTADRKLRRSKGVLEKASRAILRIFLASPRWRSPFGISLENA